VTKEAVMTPAWRSSGLLATLCERDAFDPKPLTPDQLMAFMQSETARWAPIAQDAGMKR